LQAPAMRLRVEAARTDWDAALVGLEEGAVEPAPTTTDDDDIESERFEELHAALHVAVQAVLEASDGDIVYLE
jgi:hypothetical protein